MDFLFLFLSLPWSYTISKALSIQDILNTPQGLKVSPRIQGLLSRSLQGYKVLLSRFYSQGSLQGSRFSKVQGSTLKVYPRIQGYTHTRINRNNTLALLSRLDRSSLVAAICLAISHYSQGSILFPL